MVLVAIYFMEFTSRNLMKKVKKWGRRDEMIAKTKKGEKGGKNRMKIKPINYNRN